MHIIKTCDDNTISQFIIATLGVAGVILIINRAMNGSFMYTGDSSPLPIALTLIITDIIFILCDYSISRRHNTREYIQGYEDYPDSSTYNTVKHLKYTNNEIYRYCEGFENAKLMYERSKDDIILDSFKNHVN
jgi:hypothetical protein